MNHAFALNVLIVIVTILGIVMLHNPLAILALLLLREMPYSLLLKDEVEEQAPAIGFID